MTTAELHTRRSDDAVGLLCARSPALITHEIRYSDSAGHESYLVVAPRLMTPCHGPYRRAGAAPGSGHGPQPSRASLSAARDRSSRYPSVTGARIRGPRQGITHV